MALFHRSILIIPRRFAIRFQGINAADIKKLKESGVHTTKVRLRALLSARAGSALRARRRL